MSDSTLATTEPSVGSMLAQFIERGITAENVSAFAQLVELKGKVEAKDAEKEFALAFVALQADTPRVQAVKPVPNKDGSIRYWFAPFEEVMKQVAPLLTKHGFTVSFDSRFGEGRITVICTLMHKAGHSRQNQFAVRIGGGPPGSTETQADGAAKTYAKRGALCDCLNIVVEKDDDARMEGGPISEDEAAMLAQRVKACGADKERFLKFAGAAHFEAIPSGKLQTLLDFLERKERGK